MASVATILNKERPTSFTAAVLGQGAHSQPNIAPAFEPEAGNKSHTRLLDAHRTPPLASAIATAAAVTPTTYIGGPTEMMLQPDLASLLCVAAVTTEPSTALAMTVVDITDSSPAPYALLTDEQADTNRDISTD